MTHYTVELDSEAHGMETFNYPDFEETLAGFFQIKAKAKEHSKRDGFFREVRLVAYIGARAEREE